MYNAFGITPDQGATVPSDGWTCAKCGGYFFGSFVNHVCPVEDRAPAEQAQWQFWYNPVQALIIQKLDRIIELLQESAAKTNGSL